MPTTARGWRDDDATLVTAAPRPLVIAHRGASAERPEHTIEAYARAIELGADYIEPDLVATRDGILIARHEAELSTTTDVADHAIFTGRRTTKTLHRRHVTGWFAEDFTLAEIRSLRARERLPGFRPANTAFDGQFLVPTFDEILNLAQAARRDTGRRIGVYPELKHPAFLAEQGIDVTALMVEALQRHGLEGADAPVFVQCFESAPLELLDERVDTPLIQLLAATDGRAQRPALDFAAMATPAGLARIADYADGIGPNIGLILDGEFHPTALVANAHEAGLAVHGWTLRAENAFLPAALQSSEDAAAIGNYQPLWNALVATGADGFFIDNLREWHALGDA